MPDSGNALLRRSLSRHPGSLLAGLALLSSWQICETLVPVAIGVIIDFAVIPRDVTALVLSVIGIAALFIVLSYSYRFGSRKFQKVREHESHALRVEVADAGLTARGGGDRASGEVLSLASADADVAAEIFFQIGRGGAALLGLLAAAIYLFVADPLTGLIVAIGVPLALLLVSLPSRAITRRSTAQQEAIGAAGRSASDIMGGLRVIKSIGGERWASARYSHLSREAATSGIATGSRAGLLEGLGALSMLLVLAAVVVAAGSRVVSGDMGIGTFIAVLGVAAFFTEPMQSLAEIIGALARSRGAADRIAAYLHETSAAPANQPNAPSGADITVDAGSLRLENLPLDDAGRLDFTAEPGRLTAVVVQNPSTTTALVDALSALDDPAAVVVPHHVDLFEGTVRSNIALDHAPHAPVADEVVDASASRELIELLSGGIDHRIHDLGTNLSGGQRQRIALARALHADPPVLVLHDPTTAVDAVTEAEVAGKLAAQRRGRCTVVVTSSPAFLAAADGVCFVESGTSAVIGTHHELAENFASYREVVSR